MLCRTNIGKSGNLDQSMLTTYIPLMIHSDKQYVRKVLKLGFPLLAGNFSFYLLQVADTIMVGRLGTGHLAAIAMAGLSDVEKS